MMMDQKSSQYPRLAPLLIYFLIMPTTVCLHDTLVLYLESQTMPTSGSFVKEDGSLEDIPAMIFDNQP
jgi:hypothetical protein